MLLFHYHAHAIYAGTHDTYREHKMCGCPEVQRTITSLFKKTLETSLAWMWEQWGINHLPPYTGTSCFIHHRFLISSASLVCPDWTSSKLSAEIKLFWCRFNLQLWWNGKQGLLNTLLNSWRSVLGLLVCLAGYQARDECLGCSKLDKMAVYLCPPSLLSLTLYSDSDGRLPRTELFLGTGGGLEWEHNAWSNRGSRWGCSFLSLWWTQRAIIKHKLLGKLRVQNASKTNHYR